MNPLRLYLDNFECHDKSFIDFTLFNSALIVGKIANNENYSNGVGKTTIFQAIEYVLFNQANTNLEKIIRDDTSSCKVVFDFISNNQEFRVSRSRTKKGSTDISLFKRNAATGDNVNHIIDNDMEVPVTDELFWKDISGRRASDTEKELTKILKINFKSFVSTIHFAQNDFTGLPTATPEKRKGILKEVLGLLIYSKLEKLAKDRQSVILKDIDKNNILIEALKPTPDILVSLNKELVITNTEINNKSESLIRLNGELNDLNVKINDLNMNYSNLESKFSGLINQEKSIISDIAKSEISVKEYKTKKANIIAVASALVKSLKELKEKQETLSKIDFSKSTVLTDELNKKKQEIADLNALNKISLSEYKKLQIPLPDDSLCKHCRQPLSSEHREICKNQIDKDIAYHLDIMQSSKKKLNTLNSEVISIQQSISAIILSEKQFGDINLEVVEKSKEISDKKDIHDEYSSLLTKFSDDLLNKEKDLLEIKEQLKNSSLDEANVIKLQIDKVKADINNVNIQILFLNKELTHFNSRKAVIQHDIVIKSKDLDKLNNILKNIFDLNDNVKMYPLVINAFSSVGIPNLIIQNMLDELQIEANILLSQLKPGLQLSFFIEKTNGDGLDVDTLDILYHINGKERYYAKLSGAMQVAVMFSLKLGLSRLLKNINGTDIKLLLLDEIDQSLDKAGVDAFADIIKTFQSEFTILVITHNDRLKDKFSHAILVDQDINMVSRAKVVKDW